MVLLVLTLLAPALASPDRVAWTTTPLSEATDLAVSPDGLAVVMADPSGGSLASLDLRSWSTNTVSTCGGSVGAAVVEVDGDVRVYTGCDDGTVTWVTLDDADLTSSGESIDVADGPVLGLTSLDGIVYVLTEPEDGSNPTMHTVDPSDEGLDDETGFPTTLGHSGYQDIENSGTYVLVLHGSDNLSRVDPSTGNASTEQQSLGVLDGVDLVTTDTGRIYGAGGAAVAWYDLSGNDWSLYLDSGDGLEDVDAICLLPDDEQLLVADGGAGTFKLFSYDDSSGTFGDDVEDSFAFATSGAYVTEAVAVDGYVVTGTEIGEVWVLTDAPWVEVSTVEPSAVAAGESVSVTFQSDTDGDYEVRVGADDDDGGTLVAEGEVSADTSIEVTVDVGDDFAEGDNQIRIVVTDSSGVSGHDSAVVSVDNPPDRVDLDDDSVGFGDDHLTLTLTTPDAEDITTIRVYVSATAFSREDWADGGGPDFDGDGVLDSSALTESDLTYDVSPDEQVELVISPLTNDVTYHLAVRAIDSGGLEGPMSTVVTGTPEETYSASELAGEQGGFCGTPGMASAALSLLGLGVAVGRRRRALAAAVLAVGVGALSSPAQADEWEDEQARVRGSTQLRVGPMYFDNGNVITDVQGETGHNVFWLETGPSWKSILLGSVGVGFYRKKGNLVSDSGVSSSQDDVLWAVPLTANLTVRLDFFEEQILVPYGTAGGDYWLWRESWTETADGDKEGVGGGKAGYHYGAGLQLLLDPFEPKRAALALTRLGIKDSYITAEWRRQEVGFLQDGLDLSTNQVTFGLNLNY